jgi:hypothetical protein
MNIIVIDSRVHWICFQTLFEYLHYFWSPGFGIAIAFIKIPGMSPSGHGINAITRVRDLNE